MKPTGPLRLRLVSPPIALLLWLTVGGWGTAQAGPADTPLPTFSDAKPAVSAYVATGVIKNNNLETVFVCTNLDSGPLDIGVEVFDETGAPRNAINADNGAILDVGPGATVTIATGATAVLHEDGLIALDATGSGMNNLRNGSGRVVATAQSVSCTAMVADKLHSVLDPATFPNAGAPTMANLPLMRTP